MSKPLVPVAAAVLACLAWAGPSRADSIFDDARLLRFPDIHGDTVVFCYGGDVWSVPAAGGTARRLTTGEGLEMFPRFSNDGRWIAFTGHYDGTSDVYVIPAGGGEPRRLTFYPSQVNSERLGWDNMVLGWTPEGRILFRGQRNFINGFVGEPYTVSPEGGPVERFPLPESGIVSFSPDGQKVAYTRIFRDFRTWKRYKGGMAQDVWIHDLRTRATERITDWVGTDTQPMWIGDAVYFISDREDWKLNLWKYDVPTRQTTRATDFKEFDVKWAHAGTGQIVFENGGFIHRLDPRDGVPRKLTVALPDDRRLARTRWTDVKGRITSFSLAPGAARAAFTARGDVFSVPAEHGTIRNLTDSQGVREKSAAWSPDGKWVAYVSDASGEEEIHVLAQDGRTPPRQVTSGSSSWHFAPVWSPDSKKIAWADRSMRLYWVDVETKQPPVQADLARVQEITDYTFSPDSKWIAYTKRTENTFTGIFLYSLEAKAVHAATPADGSQSPAFDPEGKYLYFLSDRDVSPTLGSLELSFTVNKMTRPQALVLRADLPSPVAPKSDEVKPDELKAAEARKDEKGGQAGQTAAKDDKKKAEPFRIDLPGLAERVVSLPVAPGNYAGLAVAAGKLIWVSFPTQALTDDDSPKASLRMFDFETRKEAEIVGGVQGLSVAPDGAKLLVQVEKGFAVVEPKENVTIDKTLDLAGLRMDLDPKAEWAQIFRDTWRIQRDFFYVADMGGIDWPAMRTRYEPLLPYVSHRSDLTYLLGELAGELGSGHSYVGGGDQPRPERRPVGLLGAELRLDAKAGAWQIARVYPGQSWVSNRRSPLTEPGTRVAEGEYLLAIDGKDLGPADEPYRLLAGKADALVTLLVGKTPVRKAAREVTIKTITDEDGLRYHDWVERNRKKVQDATGGRVGYLHIPDMGGNGLQEFIRQYYPQVRKEALIVDVRANGGGFVSEMILERLRRVVMAMGSARGARPSTYPVSSFSGPMVALINAYSASDGDIFPFFFREYGLGPLIGTRTWGGVVGIRGQENLVDGGYAYVPEFGTFSLKGQWLMENEGVSPDIEVDNLPADELAGKDAQLDRAIEEILKRLAEKKTVLPEADPPSPDLRRPQARRP
jgi:tricorn protease